MRSAHRLATLIAGMVLLAFSTSLLVHAAVARPSEAMRSPYASGVDSLASTTATPAISREGALYVYDASDHIPGLASRSAGFVLAAKAGDDVVDVGTDLAVRPKLKPGYHYLHERKMERSIRTADVLDA